MRPKLTVFRSNKYIYAQVINLGKTVAEAHGKDPIEVGKTVAEKAIKAKVTKISFDKGSYKYHGQVKALADAARQEGLDF